MFSFITKISENQLVHFSPTLLSPARRQELTRLRLRIQVDMTMSVTVIPEAPSGHFNLLYFAGAGTFTGKQFEPLPAPLPPRKLFATLEHRYAGIRDKVLESCLVTINLNYVDVPEDRRDGGADEPTIREGDEVAIVPPVSSG